MNFLFPAFLLAAAAIAIPILLHFRRQPPQKAVPFSSLMFLEQTPVPPRTRRKLEDWLLLALMFSRPFFRGDKLTTPATGTRWCLLVDTSASMRRPGMWDAAAKEFQAALDKIAEDDSAELVCFDRAPRVVVSAETWRSTSPGGRVAMLKGAWKEMQLTWAGTDLGKALLFAAGELSDDAGAPTAHARIVLISDMQEGASLDALHAGAWPEGVSVTQRRVGGPWKDNLSLSPAAALVVDETAEIPATGAPQNAGAVQLRVRVTSSPESKVEKFSLSWKEGGERVEATVPAGGSRIMTAPARSKPDADGVLDLRGDELDFDNRIFVARPHPRDVRVLCVGDNLSRSETGSPFFYLSRALSPTPALQPTLVGKSGAELQEVDLREAQVLMVFGDLPAPQSEWVRHWVTEGHPLVHVPGAGDAATFLRAMLGDAAIKVTEARGDALLQDLRFEHPMLRSFAESGVRDFSRIRFWKHRKIELPEAVAKQADVLARFDDGSVAWVEFPVGKGHMLCLASGWSPADSQLAVSSKFVPMMYGLFDWGLGDLSSERGGVVGDPVASQMGNWHGTVPVVRPDGSAVQWDTSAAASYGDTGLPGIYRIGEGSEARSIAINLAPGEGRLAPVDERRLAELGVRLEKARSASEAATEAVAQLRLEDSQHEQRQKGWKTLLLAALVVLLLETWLAGRREAHTVRSAPEPA